jgi:hypothetical protein
MPQPRRGRISARQLLQGLAQTATSDKVRLRACELIMVLDGKLTADAVTPRTEKETAKLDAGLSKLIGVEMPEKSAEND